MAQNFLQPKGNLFGLNTKAGTNDIMQEWAKSIAETNTENAKDPLRETVTEIVKSKLMNPVEVPKYATLNDVLSAQKGDKLGVFANFLSNPQTIRTIGSLLGGTYMDRFGNFVHDLDKQALQQEALIKSEQDKALMEEKMQNALAGNIYDAFQQMDIANMNDKRARELAKEQQDFMREEHALDRGLQLQKLNADIAHQRAMEGIARERLNNLLSGGSVPSGGGGSSLGGSRSSSGGVTGGAANVGGVNLNNIKMTAADRKSLTENKTTLANIEAGLKSLDENPNAYSFLKGLLGADITNRIDPKGVATRTQIDNITAVYRKWLTGAQMSDKERKAYERFLPAPTDNYTIVKSKLEGMRGAVQRSNDALLSNYGISDIPSTGNKPKRIYK